MPNLPISGLTASASNAAATDVLPVVQTTGTGPVKMTVQQMAGGLLGSTTLSGATITADAPVLNMSQTWNNGAVTFTGLKFNAAGTSDANSASGSLLMDLQVGGTTRARLIKDGTLQLGGATSELQCLGVTLNNGTIGNTTWGVYLAGNTGDMIMRNTGSLAWTNGVATVTKDLFLTRRAAANLRLGAADVGATTTTVTITIAAPGVVTWSSHGFSTGTPVVFTTTGALPTGITSGTTYYAVVVDANTFQIASSVANAIAATPTVITTSGSQSGTHTGTRYNITQRLSMQSVTGVTDRLGADLIITGSQGTGTGGGGDIIFQTASAGASGTTPNGLSTIATFGPNTVSGSQTTPLLSLAQTWNTSGLATGIRLNIVNTASSLSSRWLDFQHSGTSRFSIGPGALANGYVIKTDTLGEISNDNSVGLQFRWSTNTVVVLDGSGVKISGGLGAAGYLTTDANNTLALRNGANAQTFNIYNTFTDASNYERGRMQWSGNEWRIGTEALGTGTLRSLGLYSGGTRYQIIGGGFNQFDQNIYMNAANIVTDTSNGFKIGTGTTQKLGFWNATPIAQPTTAVAAATVAATGTGDVVAASTTFDGYTIPQIVKAMRNAGLLA